MSTVKNAENGVCAQAICAEMKRNGLDPFEQAELDHEMVVAVFARVCLRATERAVERFQRGECGTETLQLVQVRAVAESLQDYVEQLVGGRKARVIAERIASAWVRAAAAA